MAVTVPDELEDRFRAASTALTEAYAGPCDHTASYHAAVARALRALADVYKAALQQLRLSHDSLLFAALLAAWSAAEAESALARRSAERAAYVDTLTAERAAERAGGDGAS
jgi:hypothetical protein